MHPCRAQIEERVRAIAAAVPGVHAIEKCRVRKSGIRLLMDIHVVVDGDLPVRDGHAIAHRVKDALLAGELPVFDVVVHIEPDEEKAEARKGSRPEDPVASAARTLQPFRLSDLQFFRAQARNAHAMCGCDFDVFFRPLAQCRLAFRGEGLDHGGHTHGERAGRHNCSRCDQRMRADDGVLADHGTVENRGLHADQALVLDRARMDHRGMTDRDVSADANGKFIGEMYDGPSSMLVPSRSR